MLKIRLARVGRKHDPSYRVIVTEKGRAPQTGAYKEALGTYDPRSDEYDLKAERIQHWLNEGAQPSETVHNLLVKAGIVDEDTVNPLPKKSPVEAGSEPETEDRESENETDTSSSAETADKQNNEADEKTKEVEEEDGEEGQDESDDTSKKTESEDEATDDTESDSDDASNEDKESGEENS